ncbi:MAG: hypothetical protein CHACPFDD_00673 [Phycisphaerae bacterium]|nr:hypothetical protein [Phycisphaerae bacterium]
MIPSATHSRARLLAGVLSALVVTVSVGHGQDRQATRTEGRPVRPVVAWSGKQSHITASGQFRVTSAKEWEALWTRHKPDWLEKREHGPRVPEIDFEKYMVIAIFAGSGSNVDAIVADAIVDEADALRFRYRLITYQTQATADAVTPFGIFVVPRSQKPILLEERVVPIVGEPSIHERGRL